MPSVYNNGNGGYTCDRCKILLWSGFIPNRYVYVEHTRRGDKIYCDRCNGIVPHNK